MTRRERQNQCDKKEVIYAMKKGGKNIKYNRFFSIKIGIYWETEEKEKYPEEEDVDEEV